MPAMLIADDNEQITKILAKFAQKEGFTADTVYDGAAALAQFARHPYDILLLDVMMPKMDGFAVCRTIRQHSNVPIIMITARGEDYERIMGLDIGADDYIVKPFSAPEVMARVRAVLRRLPPAAQQKELTLDNLILKTNDCRAVIADEAIPLTKKETDILQLLLENQGRVFSREHLLDSLWGAEYDGDTRTIDSHIKRLRAKLDGPFDHKLLHTIRGMGYVLENRSVG